MTADLEKLVKPLVWTKHPKIDGWRCDTLVGTYKVFGIGPTPSWDFDSSNGEARSCVSETVEAAKAAAQSDYARRIAAALDPDAVAKMVQDAVKAEREACEVVAYNYMISQGFYDCHKQAETISAAIRARGEA